MKKLTGFLGAYLFYYIGDFISNIMHLSIRGKYFFDESPIRMKIGGKLYDLYNKSMNTSIKIQDWGGSTKPWKKVEDNKIIE